MNYYPPYQAIPAERRQEIERGFVRGLNAHRDDQSLFTLLIQDEPGLEVLSHDGNWVDVPVIPGSVVVNVGLALTELTAGAIQATVHRVNNLKITKPRLTAPYFFIPALSLPLTPIPHSLPTKFPKVPPSLVLSNAIPDPGLRFVHRRLATMYNNAERFWPEEWRLLNELLESSKKVMLLTGRLKGNGAGAIPADIEAGEWPELLGKL